MLEDQLREAFAALAEAPPALDNPAARAIRRAAVIQRRRALLAGVAGVVVLTLAGTGVVVLRDRRPAPQQFAGPASEPIEISPLPSPARPSVAAQPPIAQASPPVASVYGGGASIKAQSVNRAALGLDLRVGNELWTTDGRRLPLPGAGEVTWIYRVPTGWVYGGTTDRLRLLRQDGRAVDPGLVADAVAVAPGGERVAWASGPTGAETLDVGTLSATGLRTVASTALDVHAVPVGFAGTDVVLGRADNTGQISAYDFWDPAVSFRPTWNDQIARVYGPGGTRLVGVVSKAPGSGVGCLAVFDLDRKTGLRKSESGGCGLGLSAGGTFGAQSPGGQWVADQTPDGVVFVDVAASLLKAAKVGGCAVQGRSAPVWETGDQVLIATEDGGIVRCGPYLPARPITMAGLSGTDWDLVPALGN